MKTIYLAGAIDKNHRTFCKEWRNEITEELKGFSVDIINPIKGKSLDKEYDPDEIYYGDLEAVEISDIIFAEMKLNRFYLGTSIELHHANAHSKDIIVWGNTHKDHYFIRSIMNEKGNIVRRRCDSYSSAIGELLLLLHKRR